MLSIQKVNFTLFKNSSALVDTLSHFRWMAYQIKHTANVKRGLILRNMVADKDKKKNWHFNIMANRKPKCRNVFENVHRPTKRQNVLNSVFIKNITDVVSTGDVATEILGYGIEITGVKISPCCRLCNVFWQVPVRQNENANDIAEKLHKAAPNIRAELISRNVLGRVPHIFFLRDDTNARIAAFEEAMAKLDLPSDTDSSIVPDDSFLEDIYKFRKSKVTKEISSVTEDKSWHTSEEKVSPGLAQNPPEMKSDVFGLKHDVMMEKVLASKKKAKEPQQSAVITPQMLEDGDVFSTIPGICFQPDTTREEILQKFQIDRKKRMQNRSIKIRAEDFKNREEEGVDDFEPDRNIFGEDFVEEDSTDNFKL